MLESNYNLVPNKAGWYHEDTALDMRQGKRLMGVLDDESSTDEAIEGVGEEEQNSSNNEDVNNAVESSKDYGTATDYDAAVTDATASTSTGANMDELVVPRLYNGKLMPCEKPIQHHTKGAPDKVTIDMLPQSVHTARPLYDRNMSAVYGRGGNKPSVIVGPLALGSDRGLLKTGETWGRTVR